MTNKLNKIILKNADWAVKTIDFDSQKIKKSLAETHRKQEESLARKDFDPEKLKLVIKL